MRADHRPLTEDECRRLAQGPFVDVQSHTVNHLWLAAHPAVERRARSVPRMARWLLSVPPLVKTISEGLHARSAATCALAPSSASLAGAPAHDAHVRGVQRLLVDDEQVEGPAVQLSRIRTHRNES